MAIIQLLEQDFVRHYHSQSHKKDDVHIPVGNMPFSSTALEGFDVKDKNGAQTVPIGTGTATYRNPHCHHLILMDYEGFIDSLPDHIKKDKKRPDLMCETEDNEWFIINELSTGAAKSKRSDAMSQFQGALNDLYRVPSIESYLDNKQRKMCVLSLRKNSDSPSRSSSVLGPNIEAFERNNQLINKPIERQYQQIAKRNFVVYETDILVIEPQSWG